MTWDWEKQREDTAAVVRDLQGSTGIPPGARISLDVQTVAADDARRTDYVSRLKSLNWTGSAYTDAEGNETIEVTFPEATFAFDSIWELEKAVTEVALQYGYRPDGWGFREPDA